VDLLIFLSGMTFPSAIAFDADQYYLLGKKRVRGSEAYHQAAAGDNLWKVSQRYGVQLKKLKKYNRMSEEGRLSPEQRSGWLR
jgi:membrane-bound lytic murein transglycosylase D